MTLDQRAALHALVRAYESRAPEGVLSPTPESLDGVHFGRVAYLTSTGANDVMVVEGDRERWLPFKTPDYVTSVDFDARRITVDWDPDF